MMYTLLTHTDTHHTHTHVPVHVQVGTCTSINYHIISMQGEVVDLRVNHAGLKQYITELKTVLNRYQSRLEWLHKG